MDSRITKIPNNMAVVMAYPNIQLLMCGVIDVRQYNDGTIKITYSDNKKESAVCKTYIEDMTIFQAVSFVKENSIKEEKSVSEENNENLEKRFKKYSTKELQEMEADLDAKGAQISTEDGEKLQDINSEIYRRCQSDKRATMSSTNN